MPSNSITPFHAGCPSLGQLTLTEKLCLDFFYPISPWMRIQQTLEAYHERQENDGRND